MNEKQELKKNAKQKLNSNNTKKAFTAVYKFSDS